MNFVVVVVVVVIEIITVIYLYAKGLTENISC